MPSSSPCSTPGADDSAHPINAQHAVVRCSASCAPLPARAPPPKRASQAGADGEEPLPRSIGVHANCLYRASHGATVNVCSCRLTRRARSPHSVLWTLCVRAGDDPHAALNSVYCNRCLSCSRCTHSRNSLPATVPGTRPVTTTDPWVLMRAPYRVRRGRGVRRVTAHVLHPGRVRRGPGASCHARPRSSSGAARRAGGMCAW